MSHRHLHALSLALAALALASGCSSTPGRAPPPRDATPEYVNLSLRAGSYRRLIIEPVTVLRAEDSAILAIPQADLQALVDALHTSVVEHLERDYALVSTPAPDVLRLRVALAEDRPTEHRPTDRGAEILVATGVLSRSLPPEDWRASDRVLAAVTADALQGTRLEIELSDATTGALFLKISERRDAGAAGFLPRPRTWHEFRREFDDWGARIRDRLARLRALAAGRRQADATRSR